MTRSVESRCPRLRFMEAAHRSVIMRKRCTLGRHAFHAVIHIPKGTTVISASVGREIYNWTSPCLRIPLQAAVGTGFSLLVTPACHSSCDVSFRTKADIGVLGAQRTSSLDKTAARRVSLSLAWLWSGAGRLSSIVLTSQASGAYCLVRSFRDETISLTG